MLYPFSADGRRIEERNCLSFKMTELTFKVSKSPFKQIALPQPQPPCLLTLGCGRWTDLQVIHAVLAINNAALDKLAVVRVGLIPKMHCLWQLVPGRTTTTKKGRASE